MHTMRFPHGRYGIRLFLQRLRLQSLPAYTLMQRAVRREGERKMKGINEQGQAVYYNVVIKHGKVRYLVQAASGQTISGRDRQKRKSRTFVQEHQAAAWLQRNGYVICG